MTNRGRMWTDAEIALLQNVWSEDSIQSQLKGALRNEVPYKKIMAKLEKDGYNQLFKQCRVNTKVHKKHYEEIVDRQRKSGVRVESDKDLSIPDFKWFEDLHRVMKGRAVVSSVHLLDSTNPGYLPTPVASGVSQEEKDGEEGVPLESSAEMQTYQSEGSTQLYINTPSSSHTANTPSGSHTATPTPSGSCTATSTPAAEGAPKKKAQEDYKSGEG